MSKFLIGLILGIAIAGGLVFYLNNMPNQFVNKMTNNASMPISNGDKPVILAPGTTLREADTQNKDDSEQKNSSAPNYDFYKILQGEKADSAPASGTGNAKPDTKYYIQAGAFDAPDLANDMKARLALLGISSRIRGQQQADKIINRVIIGPFDSEAQARPIIEQLNDNNINTTLITINN